MEENKSGGVLVILSIISSVVSLFWGAFIFGTLAVILGGIAVAQGNKGGWVGVVVGLVSIFMYIFLIGSLL